MKPKETNYNCLIPPPSIFWLTVITLIVTWSHYSALIIKVCWILTWNFLCFSVTPSSYEIPELHYVYDLYSLAFAPVLIVSFQNVWAENPLLLLDSLLSCINHSQLSDNTWIRTSYKFWRHKPRRQSTVVFQEDGEDIEQLLLLGYLLILLFKLIFNWSPDTSGSSSNYWHIAGHAHGEQFSKLHTSYEQQVKTVKIDMLQSTIINLPSSESESDAILTVLELYCFAMGSSELFDEMLLRF